jgi:predicted PurR-regulated permease PerM
VADAQPPLNQGPTGPSRPGLTPLSLLIVLIAFYLFTQVQLVIFLLLFAILFATVIERPVIQLERRGFPRAGAILSLYGLILIVVVGVSLLVAPLVTAEARIFWEEIPVIVDDVAESWRTSDNQFLATTGYRLITQLRFRMVNPPPPTGDTAIGVLTGVGGILFGLVATFVIGFYYLMEKRLFKRLLLVQLTPNSRDRINQIWNDVESKVGDWLRGQLLLMLIIGTAAGIGYGLMGVRFWLLLALWAGLTELIPIIGPWIGGIPAVAIALLDSWQKAAIVALFLMLLQLAENTILVPRIMKGTIGLSPLTVFFAVLAGGQYMGPIGALLALPIAAAIQVIVMDALRVRQERFALEPVLQAPIDHSPGWKSIVSQFLSDDDSDEPRQAGSKQTREPGSKPDSGRAKQRPQAESPEGESD